MPAGIAELQIVMKARDDASGVLAKTGNAGQRAGSMIQKHWKGASIALGAAAAATEVLARAQAEHEKVLNPNPPREGVGLAS